MSSASQAASQPTLPTLFDAATDVETLAMKLDSLGDLLAGGSEEAAKGERATTLLPDIEVVGWFVGYLEKDARNLSSRLYAKSRKEQCRHAEAYQ